MFPTGQISLQLFLIYMVLKFSLEFQNKKEHEIIYILLWTQFDREPFMYWKLERVHFIAMNCKYQNCYLTNKRNFFEDITDFDAILFNSINMTGGMELPERRSDNQIYIFVSTDSAANFPVISNDFNLFFNYSWTYKLNSDIPFPYLIVRDKRGNILGPQKNMRWIDKSNMNDIKKSDKFRLQNKTIAAAWFVTNCEAINHRLAYGNGLGVALGKYNLSLDIYGRCGDKKCPKDRMDECFQLIESKYYFYLAFENSFSEDYVTEKLLTALEHYAIPIVLGGANYTRFLPLGTYINANNLKVEELAMQMNEIIQQKRMYYNFFKWRRHYTYHASDESGDTHPLCNLCAFLNNASIRYWRRVYPHFTQWWNEFEYTVSSPIIEYGFGDPNNKTYFIHTGSEYWNALQTYLKLIGNYSQKLFSGFIVQVLNFIF